MDLAHGLAFVLAAATSLGLAAMALVRPPSGHLRLAFSVGMAALAGEALAALVLIGATHGPEYHLLWLRVVLVSGVLLPLPWCIFAATLATAGESSGVWRRRAALIGAGLLLATAASALVARPFTVPDVPGSFHEAALEWTGRLGVVVQILATVAILTGLESTLRASRALGRWRIKYLLVGLGAIFLVRFYVLGELLLFQVLTASHLVTTAATLVVGNVLIAGALARQKLTTADLAVSRQFVLRSVVAVVLGSYLLAVGGVTWGAARLGVAEGLVWASLLVVASAIGLAMLLLSEEIRWRAKQLIGRHFYETKYDYREQWTAFTGRLGSLLTLDELAPEILRAVSEAVGATRGALYLAGPSDAGYQLGASLGLDERLPVQLPADVLDLGGRRVEGGPARLANVKRHAALPDLHRALAELELVVPLAWHGQAVGVILIGPERTGAPYTVEDLAFLGTVSQQAAGAVVTTRLSEALARTREFEAFHHLTSFVLHDVKNAVSALSLLTRNAMEHFEDPRFQRDAIRTLSRTVDRMTGLIEKLGSARNPEPSALTGVDLAALLRETVSSLVAGRRVTVVADLDPVPPVLGDADALQRALENLVTNALEAMRGDGQLRLRIERRGGLVSCSIGDSGGGMAPDFMRHSLFVPFRSTKEGGWGIGLFQTREIVTAHGGRIDVASERGHGTTVTLLLPTVTGAGRLPEPETTTASAARRG